MFRQITLCSICMLLVTGKIYPQPQQTDTVGQESDTIPVLEDLYVKGTVDTVRGIVISSDVVPSGNIPIEVVTLRTTLDTITIYLAPSWYMEQQNISVKRFDRIVVVGSRVWYNERWILIATSLRKAGKQVELRDRRGNPVWKKESDW